MTKLTWGAFGERYFETGIDRGVLYLPGQDGIAWNGLTAVSEAPTGGDATPYYVDGFKYANVATSEEFEATLEALSAPIEFNQCDGRAEISPGLFLDNQPRKSFSFSYRTLIGNDLDGVDRGYKIHIVYNALAEPTERVYASLNDSPDPTPLSWRITTLPPRFPGRKSTAHLVIDSRRIPAAVLGLLEGYLYGAEGIAPRLPSPARLFEWLQEAGAMSGVGSVTSPTNLRGYVPYSAGELRNLVSNPRGRNTSGTVTIRENLSSGSSLRVGVNNVPSGWDAYGSGVALNAVYQVSDTGMYIEGVWESSMSGQPRLGINQYVYNISDADDYTLSIAVVERYFSSPDFRLAFYIDHYRADGVINGARTMYRDLSTIEPGTRVSYTFRPTAGSVRARVFIWIESKNVGTSGQASAKMRDVLFEKSSQMLEYFDGGTWNGDPDFTPTWVGTPGASTSRLVAPKPAVWIMPAADGVPYYSRTRDAVAMFRKKSTGAVQMYGGIQSRPDRTLMFEIETDKVASMSIWASGASPSHQAVNIQTGKAVVRHYWDYTNSQAAAILWNNGTPGDVIYLRVLMMDGDYDGPFFDGDTEDAVYNGQVLETHWEDVPHNSESYAINVQTLPENSRHGDMVLTNRHSQDHLYIQQNGAWKNYGMIPAPPV